MVKTIIRNVKILDDPQEKPELFEGLPDWIIQSTLKYKPELSRKLHFYSWYYLQRSLEKLNLSLDSVYFSAHKKPYLDGIYFNISHSGSVIFIVISENEIGCDVEEIGVFPKEIIEKVFSREELELNKDFIDLNLLYYSLWNAKESYLKLIGTGLRNDLKTIKVDLGKKKVIDLENGDTAELSYWNENGYSFALCKK